MQNEQTLIAVGFTPNGGNWEMKGLNQTFIARVCESGSAAFVSLYCISPNIDERPNSDNKGKPFRRYIKQCCSPGSVERAISKYDLPEPQLHFVIGGVYFLTSPIPLPNGAG